MPSRFFSGFRVILGSALTTLVVVPVFAAESPEMALPPPQRIVSLAPAITETLFALGLGSRVVGVSSYCDQPPEARKLPKVGTFTEPVAETIVSLKPDLVLTSPSPGNETAVRAIERSGVRVEVVQSEGGLAEARAAMLEVARAAGDPEAGRRLLDGIDRRIDVVRERAKALPPESVAVVVGREPLVLAGPGSYLGQLVTAAGGHNVADAVGGRWPRVGLELLVVARPEVLLDLSVAMPGSAGTQEPPSEAELAKAWAALESVPAVAKGRIVADRASLLLRPGPRLGEAAEAIFSALHPEASLPALPVAE